MNNFTIDMAAITETLNSYSVKRLYTHKLMLKNVEIKSNEHKLTQKEISKQLWFFDGTIEPYRNDISMVSPCNRNNLKKHSINCFNNWNSNSYTKRR